MRKPALCLAGAALAGLVWAGALGCTTRGSTEEVGPLTVVDVVPTARIIRSDAFFEITFSSDVDVTTVNADTVVLAPSERVNTSFLSDIGNPPLSQTRRDTLISATVVPTGNKVRLTPDEPLPAGTELSLVVSKSVKNRQGEKLLLQNGVEGNFRLDLATLDANPTVSGTSLPVGSPALVPPNLRTFTLTFSSPVQAATSDAVHVRGVGGAADALVQSVEVLLDMRTVRVTLQNGACSPLCPLTDYRLEAGTPLTGLQGQPVMMYVQEFRTLDTADLQGPALVELPRTQPSETQVRMTLSAREPSVGRLRVGNPGGPYDQQFPLFTSGPCTGFQAARACPYAATATGLDLGAGLTGRTYGALLELTDDFGNTSVFGEFTLRTVALPKVRITEVYNNPPGPSTDEKTSEFIELQNLSDTTTYDLSRMVLATLDRTSGAVVSKMGLTGLAGSPSTLAARGFAVAGGTQFDPSSVGAAQGAVVVVDNQSSRSTLLGGLSAARDSARPIALFDGDPDNGAPLVSLFNAPQDLYAPSSTFPEGASAERLDPADDDETAVWCHSQNGPTPGRVNGVNGLSACP